MANERERLFLGLALSPEVRSALQEALARASGSGLPNRMVPPTNWHITLRFLGDTPRDRRDSLVTMLRTAILPPPHPVRIDGWGAFPRAAAARVFWAGVVDESGALTRIAAAAETLAREAGFPPEDRPFRPHLTLARLRDPHDLRPLLQLLPPLGVMLPVQEITLFRSHLGNGPARYEPVETIALPEATD